MSDIRDEFDQLHVGKFGLDLEKRTDAYAKSVRKSTAGAANHAKRQHFYDNARRSEPSLPKFKCLEQD